MASNPAAYSQLFVFQLIASTACCSFRSAFIQDIFSIAEFVRKFNYIKF
jgi:hypothetical protein